MWVGFCDTKTGLSLAIAAGFRHRSHSRVRVPQDSRLRSVVSDFRLPPTWRVTSTYFYPPETDWFSYNLAMPSRVVSFYDSQGHGGVF
jgi:hypothetical protein